MINVYEMVDSNKRRSWAIMVFFVIFIVLVVWLLSFALDYGLGFIGLALIFSGFLSFVSYWWSDKIILSLSGARPASRQKDFLFYTVTENMALANHLPMPKLYVIDQAAPNAFATGRDPQHAVICATQGLIEKLDRSELEAVVAHEFSHIKNYDTRLMSIVAILVGMIVLLGDFFIRRTFWTGRSRNKQEGAAGAIILLVALLVALLSPLIAKIIQLAISRRREFLADASAIMTTRFPDGLIRALEKIASDKSPLQSANKATAHLYIVNPFKGKDAKNWMNSLFSTHPPIEERVKALKGMS